MNTQNDSQDSIPQYDAHIVPAESAARQRREGQDFGHTSHVVDSDGELSQSTPGYTVDQEGLLNNYAIEPEMYINVPGDLRKEAFAEAIEASDYAHELKDLDEDGKLTIEHDWRQKGPGLL